MLKVYIAAPFPLKREALELMTFVEQDGYEVTSTWLRVKDMPDSDAAARLDLEDVRRADVLLALNPPGWDQKGSGGRHVELGAALILERPVVLLGPRTNTFHHHSNVDSVETVDEALGRLAGLWARQLAERH